MLWQQRVDKERGTELRIKEDIEMHRTVRDKIPA